MMIATQCPNCSEPITIKVIMCARCKRFSDIYHVGKPGSQYAGQLLCPACIGLPEVAVRGLGPLEHKG